MEEGRVTRRRLVAGAAAGALGSALANVPGAEARRQEARGRGGAPRRTRPDVVVVGAGLAGLTAARLIQRAGHSVVVLEARDRVGGRTLNHSIGGGKVVEAGGEYVGPTQDHILALAKEMGVGTFPAYDDGDNVYYANGIRRTYSDTGPLGTAPPDPLAGDVAAVVEELDLMASQIDVTAPWNADQAGNWDKRDAPDLARHERGHAQHQGARRRGDAGGLRRGAARGVAAVHALLHRRRGQRVEPGQLRAADQHPRRARSRTASSAARS